MDDTDRLQTLELGRDTGRGNLLGVQPWVTPGNYASESTLTAKLTTYLEAARQRGWLNARTIVVFPEYLGTWLAVTGAGRTALGARTLTGAMGTLALRYPVKVAEALLKSREQDRFAAGLFRARATAMATSYQAVFSGLARAYGITIVAGSTVLPSPRVEDGRVVAGDGPLYGVTAVFDPDGRAYPDLARKAHPIGPELPFLTPAAVGELPTFETPAGRLGVLICADAWYPASYAHLNARGVDVLAVPSYIATRGLWNLPWRGYDGAATPDDVDPGDVGTLTEAQAWRTYALTGRIARSGARAGINVFLAGSLWDLGGEGRSVMLLTGENPVEAEGNRSALLTLWL
jgi:predicted amidohydrolase